MCRKLHFRQLPCHVEMAGIKNKSKLKLTVKSKEPQMKKELRFDLKNILSVISDFEISSICNNLKLNYNYDNRYFFKNISIYTDLHIDTTKNDIIEFIYDMGFYRANDIIFTIHEYNNNMKITIKKIIDEYGNPLVTLHINEELFLLGVDASRILTNTDSEDGIGVFESGFCRFERNEKTARIYVDSKALSEYETAKEIGIELKRRIDLINKAFEVDIYEFEI